MADEPVTGLDAVSKYVESELNYEWQRKTSIETRAIACITANVALVTLFFALANGTTLLHHLSHGASHVLLIVALAPVVLSVAFAVLAAAPANYSSPQADALTSLAIRAESRSALESIREVIDGRIVQIKAARDSGDKKARDIALSYGALGAAAILLAASLLFAF